MDKTTYTLNEFIEFSKKSSFVIPYYQRGYIWGKKTNKEKDSIHFLLDDLLKVLEGRDVFLQGITTTDDGIDIIDGQQRLTTLYLLLRTLGCDELKIQYDHTRLKSQNFLSSPNLLENIDFLDTDLQDIHFFKKALQICREEKYKDLSPELLKKHVKFLWIRIPRNKATETFTMMNGNRAKMRDDELIKAELLRLASQKQEGMTSWEGQELRGRYARAWDQWLQWWNQPEVLSWLRLNEDSIVLRWLLSVVYNDASIEKDKMADAQKLDFSKFRQRMLNGIEGAKKTFYDLRIAQKRFEDAFEDSMAYNLIGGIMSRLTPENRQKFIYAYFSPKGMPKIEAPVSLKEMFQNTVHRDLQLFFAMTFLGMTYDEILKRNDDSQYEKKLFETRRILFASSDIYHQNYEQGIMFLLYRNIMMDCLQNDNGRKFDFTIIDRRSMEHIYPKSKVWHSEGEILRRGDGKVIDKSETCDSQMMLRDSIGSFDFSQGGETESIPLWEHSLGNMVLIYREDNSAFNNADFSKKRRLYFRPSLKEKFRSRNLLHSLLVFAYNNSWGGQEIVANHKQYLEDFDKIYGIK